jgi:thioesterase domain-containing protein
VVAPSISVQTGPELEAVMHQLIPISVQMGLSVSHYDGATLELQAPLAPNINHQSSAFGGSLLAGCALAGWGLLQLQLGHLGRMGNVVVAEAESKFLAPVYTSLRVRCGLPDNFLDLRSQLIEKGSKSMRMTALVHDGLEEAVAMQVDALYVIRLNDDA